MDVWLAVGLHKLYGWSEKGTASHGSGEVHQVVIMPLVIGMHHGLQH